ncbi:MAG: SUMF1/EgtB/PvdO family nonheme iron enzyme [Rhodobacterales bacterium]|nr:SUMF1/EgtB/PvdO family nonheme iron enzyme [Rhodobacterales bacterium]
MLCLLLALLSSPVQASDWPSLSEPPPSEKLGANDAAVVIGIGDYYNVQDIPGAVDNANDWYKWLVKTRGISMSNVHIIRDAEATREQLLDEAAWVSGRVKAGGTLWYVFIGHGAPNASGVDGLLVGSDAQQTAKGLYVRSVAQSEILAELEKGKQSETMLVVDACFSGQGGGGALVEGLQPMIPTAALKSAAVTILTAGRSNEFAGPLPGGDRPAFSYLVLGALRGWGDENGDGQVTASEAVSYAEGALSGMLTTRSQTPQISGPAMSSQLSKGRESGPDLFAMVSEGTLSPASGALRQPGNDDDILGDVAAITAQLKATRELEAKLATARETALSAGASALQTKATSTWSALSELRGLGGDVAKSKVEAFIAKYTYSSVEYTDAVGTHERAVSIAEVAQARAWLQADRQSVMIAAVDEPRATSGVNEWTSPTLGTKFVRIGAGRFTMGSPSNEADRRDDEVQHQVTLSSAYYLMAHEVTQGEWQRVMGSNPSHFSGCADCPVEKVSWDDAVAYARKLSDLDGLTGGARYRLPTEAEWEYAARGGESFVYAGSNESTSVAWAGANAGYKTHPVCGLARNGYGLCDMSGNVYEWVSDYYGAYPNRSATDPAGASNASSRVNRGGSWNGYPRNSRVAYRSRGAPSYRNFLVGFRLARSE